MAPLIENHRDPGLGSRKTRGEDSSYFWRKTGELTWLSEQADELSRHNFFYITVAKRLYSSSGGMFDLKAKIRCAQLH